MTLIAENLHIISKITKEAILKKDDAYILDITKRVFDAGFDTLDLNIGPAKGALSGAMEYLTLLLDKNFNVNFSFDTSNFDEMRAGFKALNLTINPKKAENSFINSVCADDSKMNNGFEIANEYSANIIALAFDPNRGIAKTSDERLELAFLIYENALANGILENKLYFDPLVLPVSVAQEQANTVLETIRMLKEGMGEIHTIVGLSNISNGSPKEIRPLLNRVFLVLAMGAGLDSAIVDGFDSETKRVYGLITSIRDEKCGPKESSLSSLDSLYFSLYNAVNNFSDIEEVEFDKNNPDEVDVIRAARILLNKEIYSHSFLGQNRRTES